MKKTSMMMPILAVLALASVIVSCSNQNTPDQKVIEQKIIGKWRTVSVKDTLCLTNSRSVMSFKQDGTGTVSTASEHGPKERFVWSNKKPFTYVISGNDLCLTQTSIIHYYHVNAIDDNAMTLHLFKMIRGEKTLQPNSIQVYEKVTSDFSAAIVGLWEGESMTGEETYGTADARIEYKADGTYTYYKKVGQNWVPSTNVDNEYNVDGNWLATRWRPEAGADYNYEWWDIVSVSDTKMEWSALREKEDGSRFNATFTWKKVK